MFQILQSYQIIQSCGFIPVPVFPQFVQNQVAAQSLVKAFDKFR